MQKIVVDNQQYELITNYRNAYDENDFLDRYTDYFQDYDSSLHCGADMPEAFRQ